MLKRVLIVALLCVFGVLQAADKLVGGPYVVNATTQSATLGWVVESSDVQIGNSPQALTTNVRTLRCERVPLTGLQPGTTVYYDVLGRDDGRGHFKTPPVGPASFEFVVFGDTRTRHELHQKVVDAIVKVHPDFVIHTGDLVQDGNDEALWPVFFSIEKEMLRNTVFFPVLGNHERNNARFHEFFDGPEPYYSFDWGTSHFVLINSDVTNVSKDAAVRKEYWDRQTRWLERDLEQSQKADFRFVVMHHPPFTVNQKPNHVSKETPTLVPLFEKYKVAAVLAGHDHNYQHHLKNGIHYIVTGGGGAPLAPADPPLDITRKVESTEHFVPVKVEGKRATIQAIALDGHLIETIDLKAQ